MLKSANDSGVFWSYLLSLSFFLLLRPFSVTREEERMKRNEISLLSASKYQFSPLAVGPGPEPPGRIAEKESKVLSCLSKENWLLP